MKTLSIVLAMMTLSCLKPVPPPPEVPQVVIVEEITPPHVPTIVIEPDAAPPVHTWMTGQEAIDAQKERERRESSCFCEDGDPLCECVP